MDTPESPDFALREPSSFRGGSSRSAEKQWSSLDIHVLTPQHYAILISLRSRLRKVYAYKMGTDDNSAIPLTISRLVLPFSQERRRGFKRAL